MVIITGASRGIGQYLFKELLNEGLTVKGTYNSTLPAKEIDEFLTKVDISDFSQVEQWINSIDKDLNNLVLINCAGKSYNSFAHKSDIEAWKNVIDVNLIGTFNIIRLLLPKMREQNYGRIINFSSVVAKIPTQGVSAYASSKAALWGLTKSLAAENSTKGITINNINLGYSTIGMINEVPEEFLMQIKLKIPAGKLCEPADILKTVKYLIDTSYINGTSIDLNGGMI
jgi:NAD(P)-dependent dehydrogenase (short-subunit alcohol dehydrogenase family)